MVVSQPPVGIAEIGQQITTEKGECNSMKITQSMVDLMKSFSIMSSCQDTIGELRVIYRFGLVELSYLSYDE